MITPEQTEINNIPNIWQKEYFHSFICKSWETEYHKYTLFYHFEFGKQKHKTTHADMNIYNIFKFSISHFLAIGINNRSHIGVMYSIFCYNSPL